MSKYACAFKSLYDETHINGYKMSISGSYFESPDLK